jgi:translation initiation factor IF-1
MSQNCQHQFGYLSWRSEGEEIPEECMFCEKLLECMRSKPTSKSSLSQPESGDMPVRGDLPAQESQAPTGDDIENSHDKSTENVRMEPAPDKPPESGFVVENLGMMYASWTNTVRIDQKILSEWSGKVKEVEIETVDGRLVQCRVKPMKKAERRVVQIPDKIQTKLKIKAGDTVFVKPRDGSRNENKIRAMITDYARSILASERARENRARKLNLRLLLKHQTMAPNAR